MTNSKIVCTLGPASDRPEMIRALADAGMDCARINFSHGSPGGRAALFARIREAAPEVAILCDIQGPKIRIGRIADGGVRLETGATVRVTSRNVVGDADVLPVSYDALPRELAPAERLFINDGLVCLRVEELAGDEVVCRVEAGGLVSTGKGVNLPSTALSLKVPTEKDRDDLRQIAALGPEYVAVSFVESGADVERVRAFLADCGNRSVRLVAKIERPAALRHFTEIVAVSDGVMVARGDLGVEIPAEDVVPRQKAMVRECNVAGKPVIVATQMLESMVHSAAPTRAEVSDVYNAIADGADAVMLSAETATGDYPLAAVQMMERIISRAESLMAPRDPDQYDSDEESTTEVIGHLVHGACGELADMGVAGGRILCLTQTGETVRLVAKYRPRLPVLAATPSVATARALQLVWGAQAVVSERPAGEGTMARVQAALRTCLEQGLVGVEEPLIVAANLLAPELPANAVVLLTAGEVLDCPC